MQIFGLRGIALMTIFFMVAIMSHQPAEGSKALLLAIPALLLKAGLAAPLVLGVIVKLMFLAGLKTLLFPKLLLLGKVGKLTKAKGLLFANRDDSHEKLSYGRRKRSLDFVESIIGDIPFNEDELLEAILKVDSKRCGERLLCEVAASQAKHTADDDEKAIVALFSMNQGNAAIPRGTAKSVYTEAMLNGFKGKSCAAKYEACPYSRAQMMGIVHAIADEPTQ